MINDEVLQITLVKNEKHSMKKQYNNTEINAILKEQADALLNMYVGYFDDEFATLSENQKKRKEIKRQQEAFAKEAFRLVFKTTNQTLISNYKEYWGVNSSVQILKHDIKTNFNNAIFEVYRKNIIQALMILFQKGSITKNDLGRFFENPSESILINYKNYDDDKFIKKTIDKINKSIETSSDPIKMDLNNSLKGLLHRITERRIIDAQRKLNTEVELFDHSADIANPKPRSPFTELPPDRDERMDNWSPILYQLSRKDQVFMALFYRLVPEEWQQKITNKEIAEICGVTNLDYPAIRRNVNMETLKAIVNGEKKKRTPRLPHFERSTKEISEKDDAFMKELILTKQNEHANKVFKELFKKTPEFNVLILWDWIWEPTDAQVATVFEVVDVEQVPEIMNYYKLSLLEALGLNKK